MTRRQPNLLILLAGFFTSGLALLAVAIVNLFGFNIMGLNFAFIFPAGALIVGLLAGSGYAVTSKLFNVKVRPEFFLILFLVAVITYFLSHYVTYRFVLWQNQLTTENLTFVEYVKTSAENSTIKSTRHGQAETQLGTWGYLFLVLELIGFTIGSLVPTLLLGTKPYCENCQLYMDKVETVYHRSDREKPELKAAKGKQAKLAVLNQAVQEAMLRFTSWWERDQSLPWQLLEPRLDAFEITVPKEALAFVQCDLYLCDACESWHMIAQVQNVPLSGHPLPRQVLDSRTQPRLPPLPPPPPPPPGSEGIQEQR